MKIIGSFLKFAKLAELPTLVRKQQRLVRKMAPLEPLVEQEKAVRKDIDALLVDVGVGKGEAVECVGFEVAHNERAGQAFINQDKLVLLLAGAGFTGQDMAGAMAWVTDAYAPSSFATVKPLKGAKVRA